nr:MAG TPA: hypothetical protein [Caudoviricetes sp.]
MRHRHSTHRTPKRDGHHPLIHSHTVHVHNDQRTIMINVDQQSMFND